MADPLLSFVAERIIEVLCSPAVKQIGLFWGVKDELQSLTDTVSTIKDVLLDAKDKQAAGDRAVQRWLGRLEDVIYDADDLLEEVSTEALRRDIMTRDKKVKKVRIFFSESNQIAFRFRMAREIKAIRKKLDAINADRQNLNLEVRQVEPRVGRRERYNTHSFVPAEVVIGREDDKKAVIDLLMDSNVEDNESVVRIIGTVESYPLEGLDEDASCEEGMGWFLFLTIMLYMPNERGVGQRADGLHYWVL
ncbi:hypothetical protein FH972_027039 [Carpinus fangiana]|uniref:Disease resistance N-terminal domain-containing protein n=1 Tax=Carpinus fangiana TaxID=176857 RepID=A0A5N6L5V7_9ROSI|nr:hypothetical protein FH972_027039 [Carpinus fangiana]